MSQYSKSIPDAQLDPFCQYLEYLEPSFSSFSAILALPTSLPSEILDSQDSQLSRCDCSPLGQTANRQAKPPTARLNP